MVFFFVNPKKKVEKKIKQTEDEGKQKEESFT